MKSPLDPAIRLQRRTVDDVRVAIRAELERLSDAETAHQALGQRMLRERALAAQDMFLPGTAWQEKLHRDRAHIEAQRRESEAQLAALRERAAEAFGQMRAMENAADRFREEAEREIESAEQSQLDDISAARMMRTLRKRRAA